MSSLVAPRALREIWIQQPRERGQLVHAGATGTVAIALMTSGSFWREKDYPVEVALDLLNHYEGRRDVYLSTQRFRGRRRIAHLLSMGSLCADLDYYRVPELTGLSPRQILDEALAMLEQANIPAPTLAISSGRGLYLLWVHSPIPRAALPRWTACQHELRNVLSPLRADPAARDAARVLRVIGTRHGGTRATVEAVAPVGEVRTFEDLAGEILPMGRAELYDLRVRRAKRAARAAQERLWSPPEGFTQATRSGRLV
jgi:hypothetical protein